MKKKLLASIIMGIVLFLILRWVDSFNPLLSDMISILIAFLAVIIAMNKQQNN